MHYLEDYSSLSVFIAPIFDTQFCYFVEQPIYAFSEHVKYCSFLQCFVTFFEQTKEIVYWKWNTALLA